MIINCVSCSVHSLFNSIISLYGTVVQVKRIIISDTHIGTKFYKSEELLSFLKNEEYDEIVLAGDIIDFIKIPVFTERCMEIMESIDIEKRIVYVVGNHDVSFEKLVGMKVFGIEFVKNKQTKDPYPEIVSTLLHQALAKRLIILSCGVYSNVIRLAPPLIISQAELDKGLTRGMLHSLQFLTDGGLLPPQFWHLI